MPLTPIQHWFFEQNLEESQHYNQACLFEVAEPMERRLLEGALAELSRQHDGLRLRYVRDTGGWRQFYSTSEEAALLRWIDLAQLPEAEQGRSIEMVAVSTQASPNLADGPLWRAVYFDLGPERPGRLLLVVHHLAVDGVSWRPLLEDLETAYQQLKAGQTVQLPPKTISFKAWADRLQKYDGAESLRNELRYWKSVTEPQRVAKPVEHSSSSDASCEKHRGLLPDFESGAPCGRDPGTVTAGSGGLQHADQRRAVDRAGAGVESMERQPGALHEPGRPRSRAPVRRCGPVAYRGLVHLDFPPASGAAGVRKSLGARRCLEIDQGAASPGSAARHWVRHPPLPGRGPGSFHGPASRRSYSTTWGSSTSF